MGEAEPYLTRLTNRLLDGVERLPVEVRERHARYLLEAQNTDGGFSGREGGSDLYYTGFALRSLAVLQALNPELRRWTTPVHNTTYELKVPTGTADSVLARLEEAPAIDLASRTLFRMTA